MVREQSLFRQSALFVEVLITLQIIFQKDQKGKKNIVRLVIRTTDELNALLGNVLDVDL